MFLNIYAPNTGAPRYIRQVLNDLQRDLDSHTVIVDLEQANLIDIYRNLHPKSTEYTFFSALHGTYSKTDHVIGSKSLLSKCKRTEIITVSQTTVQSN